MSKLDIKFKRLTPFKRCVLQNFPFIEADFDALTNYGLLCKVVAYLNKVIDSQNEVQGVTEEIVTAFNNLYDYVKNFFDNLDIQEEVNNKLDQMAEDGTLSNIFNQIVISDANYKYLQRITPTLATYNDNIHNFMQGFCYVNGKLIACFINPSEADNYTRIAEINIANGSIIREAYLELNHANAISYSEKDNKLYVASCAKMIDGVYTNDNAIFTVDYDTFELLDTINVSNIPEGHRIRSVWYDNETNTLYGGDIWDMFVIDEDNETITETIELDRTYIDTKATNQTLKKIDGYYIGTYISFIAYWDITTKNLVKIQPIDQIQDNEYIGEIEDIAFDSNKNIIIGAVNYDSPRTSDRNASFYISNIHFNASGAFAPFGATTSAKTVYVNSSNLTGFEDGTSEHPFKSLQRAVNYSMIRDNLNTRINIAEGNYGYTYVNGVRNCDFNITGDVTIDGLEVLNSDLVIESTSNDNYVVINGLSVKFSTFKNIRGMTINKFSRNDVTGSDYNVYTYFSKIELVNCSLAGNNDHILLKADKHSDVSIFECSFAGYYGYYAIDADSNSTIYTYELTLDKTVSSTEHDFKIAGGTRFYTRNAYTDANHFDIASQAMKYPTLSEVTPTHKFNGDVCVVDYHYNAVMLTVKKAGATNDHVTVTSRIEDLDHLVIDTEMLSGSNRIYGCLEFRYNDTTRVLKINFSRRCDYTYSDNTNSYETNVSDTPADETKWCSVTKVAFVNI